jgi:hypothetical protein
MPPFLQGLLFAQAASLFAFSRGTATRKTGRRTARMTMMKMMMQRITKTLRDIPQQVFLRLGAFGSSSLELSCSTLRRFERPKKIGQDPRPSGVCKPGGGKDARISDREPELRRRFSPFPRHMLVFSNLYPYTDTGL